MSTDVQKTEQEIASMEQRIKIGQAIERLNSNSDFQLVIVKGFLQDDCLRYLDLSGDSTVSEKARLDTLNIAQAGGHFKRYIEAQMTKARDAANRINDQKNFLDQLRAEEISQE